VTPGRRQGDPADEEPIGGATDPLTLTDPDGAVTRVAPWSSWTREQVRAPGGEPALVTRLEQGQLWFAAGRRRSPWRHEVHVGPAIVSTPRGRFHATAEPDGGATIACLAGRTRVVAGLREPVLLGPDQSAAVSSDGRTLVVMDRVQGGVGTPPDVIDLTDDAQGDVGESTGRRYGAAAVPADAALVGAAAAPGAAGWSSVPPAEPPAAGPPAADPGDLPELPYAEDRRNRPARLGWIPELVAVVALVGALLAAVVVFSRGSESQETTAPTTVPATTEAPDPDPTTTAAPPTTEATTTTAAPTTTTTSRPAASGATGVGELRSCRRSEAGVAALVGLRHRSGPASRFEVTVALVDASGAPFAEGRAISELIPADGTGEVEVEVPTAPGATGACEVVTVRGV
jgi:hypothetical protein